nr:hypothetical protein [Nonomuraea deserti]
MRTSMVPCCTATPRPSARSAWTSRRPAWTCSPWSGTRCTRPKGIAALYVRDGVILEPVVYGGGQERGLRAGTENAVLAAALGTAADLAGHDLLAATPQLAASTGSACHSGTHTPSPVLTAMGLDPERAMAAVRLSLGRWSTETDIETAATALIKAAA